MNKFMREGWLWVEGLHRMRAAMLDQLTDADLAYSPGGQNSSLGVLLRQSGEIERAYLDSLKTLKQDFSYRNTAPGLEGSLAQLRAWYQTLDDDVTATVTAFTDADLQKIVTRPGGVNSVTVESQLNIYIQALMIFFGKAIVYLRAMGRPLPKSVEDLIA